MVQHRIWFATLAALAAAPVVAQQDVPPTQQAAVLPQSAATQTATHAVEAGSRITVPVSITGRGPYRFLIDTGAERTAIATEVATRLGLVSAGTIRLHSISGEEQVQTVTIPLLDHGTGHIEQIRAPALRQENLGAEGILGIDSLADKRLTIDFRKRTMTISPATKRQEYWGSDVIVVTARKRRGQLILVDAAADGQKVSVILDTGTEVTVGNQALHDRLTRKMRGRRSVPITISSVTGGEIPALYTTLARIRIGEATVTDLPVAFADAHPFKALGLTDKPALLLGMDALALFDRVQIDFANKKARFDMPDGNARATPGSRLAALSGMMRAR